MGKGSGLELAPKSIAAAVRKAPMDRQLVFHPVFGDGKILFVFFSFRKHALSPPGSHYRFLSVVGILIKGNEVPMINFIPDYHVTILFGDGHIIFHIGFNQVSIDHPFLVAGGVPIRDSSSRIPHDFADVSSKSRSRPRIIFL